MKQLVNMSTPWHVQQRKLAAFFELDEAVSVGGVTFCTADLRENE